MARTRRLSVIGTVGAVLVWELVSAVSAHAITFSKLLDSTTNYPGVGQFSAFSDLAWDGSSLAVIGNTNLSPTGVFQFSNGSLSKIANTATAVPDISGGLFTSFSSIDISAGKVAFLARSTAFATNYDGVYTTLGGSLRRVRDTIDTMPGSAANYNDFSSRHKVAIDGNDIVFGAFGRNSAGTVFNEGVFKQSGSNSVVKIADRSNAIPGFSGNFIFFGDVAASNGQVLFNGGRGSGGGNGFYTTLGAPANSFRTALNENTSLPGFTNPLSVFTPNTIQIDGSDIAFATYDTSFKTGVFLDRNGAVTKIAEEGMINPINNQPFVALYNTYSLDNGKVAFGAFSSSGPTAMFVGSGGAITKVIASGDALGGKTVSDWSLFRNSFENGKIAFKANFNDGTQAIYLAQLDTPAPTGSVDLLPAFDAQAELSGSNFTLFDGDTAILAQDLDFADIDRRGLMDFSLEQVPEGATILSATLTLKPWLLSYGPESFPQLTIMGYSGNGVMNVPDATAGIQTIGVSNPVQNLDDPITIALDPAFVQSLVHGNAYLGLVALAPPNGDQIGWYTLEKSTASLRPMLHIEWIAPTPGDFDSDGDVDGADFVAWQTNFPKASGATLAQGDADGDGDVDGADFVAWQTHFPTSPGSAIAPVPEPTAVYPAISALSVLGWVALRSKAERGQKD